jgi:biotin carboxylase
MQLAEQSGVRVAQTQVIATAGELRRWIFRVSLPTVLKADGTSGGDGVRIVYTLEDAEQALLDLQAPPLLARAAKRAVVDRDQTLLWPSLLRRRSVVNAQAFVSGTEATSTAACWKGKVLASLHFEVLKKADSAGHATVVRLIENADMSKAAEIMVRRLNLSGLLGFDFILEADTGHAYLLEINPRATQVGHLTLGVGRDLPAALYSAVSGESLQPAPIVTGKDTIALFPQEWIRDPGSEFLRSAYHDVPWEEPELVRACVQAGRKQRDWYSQQNADQLLAATCQLPEHK